MTIAEELIAKGREEGRAEGREEGAVIGNIELLETVLGLPATAASVLSQRSPAELQTQLDALKVEVQKRLLQ